MESLTRRLGIATDSADSDVEHWFLGKLEEGLALLQETLSESEVAALMIEMPPHIDPTVRSPQTVNALATATADMKGVLGGTEGIAHWNHKAARAFKAAFDADVQRAKPLKDLAVTSRFKDLTGVDIGPQGVARVWVENYNQLDSFCRRPGLVVPLQRWIKIWGQSDTKRVFKGQVDLQKTGARPPITWTDMIRNYWIFTAALALTVLWSRWMLIPFALATVLSLSQTSMVTNRPWRKIHYPMMRLYARAAGVAAQERHDRGAVNIRPALHILATTWFPEWSNEQTQAFVERAIRDGCEFTLRPFVTDYLRAQAPDQPDTVNQLLEALAQGFANPDNGLMVRFVITAVIVHTYGEATAGEYLVAVARGEAK